MTTQVAPSEAPRSDSNRRRAVPRGIENNWRAATITFGVFEIAIGLWLLAITRHLWFFEDEWSFIAYRKAGNLGDWFTPYAGAHPVMLPMVMYKVLWATVGLRSYLPYEALIIGSHLCFCFLLLFIMRRAGANAWISVMATSLLVVFGSGYLNIISPFQITYVGSLLFGVTQLVLADRDSPKLDRRDWLALVAGLAALACSAIGLVTVFAVAAATLLRRGWRVALFHSGLLLTVFAVWFLVAPTLPTVGPAQKNASASDAAAYGARMFRLTFEAMTRPGLAAAGFALVVVFGLVLWATRNFAQVRTTAAAPLALLLAALVFAGVIGAGRGQHPLIGPQYLYVTAALLLPSIAVALSEIVRRWRVTAVGILALFVAAGASNAQALQTYAAARSANQQQYRAMMLTLPRLPIASRLPRTTSPHAGPLGNRITIGWLLDAAKSGKLPRPSRMSRIETATDTLRLSLAAMYFTETSERCVTIVRPLRIHLAARQGIRIERGIVRLLPNPQSDHGVYPILLAEPFTFPRLVDIAGPLSIVVMPDTNRNFVVTFGGNKRLTRPPRFVPRSRAPILCVPTTAITTPPRAPTHPPPSDLSTHGNLGTAPDLLRETFVQHMRRIS